jgi:hypothetical protein
VPRSNVKVVGRLAGCMRRNRSDQQMSDDLPVLDEAPPEVIEFEGQSGAIGHADSRHRA